MKAMRLMMLVCLMYWMQIPASAETVYVCGDVSGTWTADSVVVTCEVRVPPGQTLTIEPGVRVLFWAYCKFIVDDGATLLAMGTAGDSIRFDEYVPNPERHENRWNGIRFLNASNASRLEYCHLKHGLGFGSDEDTKGGAIYCSNSSPTIRHCLIDSCEASEGGGIYCIASNPMIERCTVIGNSAPDGGAGICCAFNSSPTIDSCTLRGNLCNGYNAHGGGIYCLEYSSPLIVSNTIMDNAAYQGGGIACGYDCNPIVTENMLWNNWASDFGGGVYCQRASPVITDNTFDGNRAEGGGGIGCIEGSNPTISRNLLTRNTGLYYGGGGIYSSWSGPTIIDNVIDGNSSDSYSWAGGGGIVCSDSTTALIEGNRIADNSAGHGGGIACQNSPTTIRGNRIRSNTTTFGGGAGIYCTGLAPQIEFNEISRNVAVGDGGGIHLSYSSATLNKNTIVDNDATTGGGLFSEASNPVLRNCILWGNTPYQQIRQVYASDVQVTYSDLQSFWPGTGNLSLYPLFADTINGDFRLQSGSPCIDSGDPDPVYNDDDGSRADQGCYPFEGTLGSPLATAWADGDTLRLVWGVVATATSYNVYAADSVTATSWSLIGSTSDTTLADPVGIAVRRFYQVRAATP